MNTIRTSPTCKPSWPTSDSTGSRSHAANLRAIASPLAAAGLSLATQSVLALEVYSCESLTTLTTSTPGMVGETGFFRVVQP